MRHEGATMLTFTISFETRRMALCRNICMDSDVRPQLSTSLLAGYSYGTFPRYNAEMRVQDPCIVTFVVLYSNPGATWAVLFSLFNELVYGMYVIYDLWQRHCVQIVIRSQLFGFTDHIKAVWIYN